MLTINIPNEVVQEMKVMCAECGSKRTTYNMRDRLQKSVSNITSASSSGTLSKALTEVLMTLTEIMEKSATNQKLPCIAANVLFRLGQFAAANFQFPVDVFLQYITVLYRVSTIVARSSSTPENELAQIRCLQVVCMLQTLEYREQFQLDFVLSQIFTLCAMMVNTTSATVSQTGLACIKQIVLNLAMDDNNFTQPQPTLVLSPPSLFRDVSLHAVCVNSDGKLLGTLVQNGRSKDALLQVVHDLVTMAAPEYTSSVPLLLFKDSNAVMTKSVVINSTLSQEVALDILLDCFAVCIIRRDNLVSPEYIRLFNCYLLPLIIRYLDQIIGTAFESDTERADDQRFGNTAILGQWIRLIGVLLSCKTGSYSEPLLFRYCKLGFETILTQLHNYMIYSLTQPASSINAVSKQLMELFIDRVLSNTALLTELVDAQADLIEDTPVRPIMLRPEIEGEKTQKVSYQSSRNLLPALLENVNLLIEQHWLPSEQYVELAFKLVLVFIRAVHANPEPFERVVKISQNPLERTLLRCLDKDLSASQEGEVRCHEAFIQFTTVMAILNLNAGVDSVLCSLLKRLSQTTQNPKHLFGLLDDMLVDPIVSVIDKSTWRNMVRQFEIVLTSPELADTEKDKIVCQIFETYSSLEKSARLVEALLPIPPAETLTSLTLWSLNRVIGLVLGLTNRPRATHSDDELIKCINEIWNRLIAPCLGSICAKEIGNWNNSYGERKPATNGASGGGDSGSTTIVDRIVDLTEILLDTSLTTSKESLLGVMQQCMQMHVLFSTAVPIRTFKVLIESVKNVGHLYDDSCWIAVAEMDKKFGPSYSLLSSVIGEYELPSDASAIFVSDLNRLLSGTHNDSISKQPLTINQMYKVISLVRIVAETHLSTSMAVCDEIGTFFKTNCVDERMDLRHCAIRTMGSLGLSPCVVVSILALVEDKYRLADNDELGTVNGGGLSNDLSSGVMVHHSRDTRKKQWSETVVLVLHALVGVCDIYRMRNNCTRIENNGKPLIEDSAIVRIRDVYASDSGEIGIAVRSLLSRLEDTNPAIGPDCQPE